MGIEVKSKDIGKHTYKVEQFGAKAGGRMLVRLAKMLGGAVGGAIEAGDEVDVAAIGKTLTGFAENIAESDYDYLCDAFSAKTRVTGGVYGSKEPLLKDFFDDHFAGNYVELGEWLYFCLEANYGSFLDVVEREIQKLKADGPPPDSDGAEVEESSKPSESQAT